MKVTVGESFLEVVWGRSFQFQKVQLLWDDTESFVMLILLSRLPLCIWKMCFCHHSLGAFPLKLRRRVTENFYMQNISFLFSHFLSFAIISSFPFFCFFLICIIICIKNVSSTRCPLQLCACLFPVLSGLTVWCVPWTQRSWLRRCPSFRTSWTLCWISRYCVCVCIRVLPT